MLGFTSAVCTVRALYDYEAMSDEELTFKEGDIITVLQKEDDMDDGFWTGEINGMRGVFPSLVVEEIETSEAAKQTTWTKDSSPVHKPTNLGNGNGLGDYVTLPLEYSKGKTTEAAATAQPLKATRRAPPPPASSNHAHSNMSDNLLAPMDRQRAQTENAASLRGRSSTENKVSYSRSASQGEPGSRPLSMYENINQLHPEAAAKNPPNYVNYNSIPSSAGATTRMPPDYVNFDSIPSGSASAGDRPTGRTRPKAPPKPPPPSSTKRAYMSKSYV